MSINREEFFVHPDQWAARVVCGKARARGGKCSFVVISAHAQNTDAPATSPDQRPRKESAPECYRPPPDFGPGELRSRWNHFPNSLTKALFAGKERRRERQPGGTSALVIGGNGTL